MMQLNVSKLCICKYLQLGWNANIIKLSFVSTNPDGITYLAFSNRLFLISFTRLVDNVVDCRPKDSIKLNSKDVESDLYLQVSVMESVTVTFSSICFRTYAEIYLRTTNWKQHYTTANLIDNIIDNLIIKNLHCWWH